MGGPVTERLKLDLLFVVDTSNSMAEEQVRLSALIPDTLRMILSGDLDRDGSPDAQGIPDIHVGIITPDLGTGRVTVSTCGRYFGDDGILQSIGVAGDCDSGGQRSFLRLTSEDTGGVAELLDDSSCVANAGLNGCGFEQPLEAVMKALAGDASTLSFRDGTVGHANAANHGFLRHDSTLAIVLITDEDDCSVPDVSLFDNRSPLFSGSLNLRCVSYPDHLHPLRRFVDGLAEVRGGDLRNTVFLSVVGVPTDLVPNASTPDYVGVLADSRMREQVDPEHPTRLRTTCHTPTGSAYPARRIIRFGQLLEARGATTLLGSICEQDYEPMLNRFAEDILRQTQPDAR
jgi:hypothetical protein